MSAKTNSPLSASFKVVANCEIKLGDKCTIKLPGHTNHQQYAEYNACNDQEATVVGYYPAGSREPTSVNLRMDTGPCAGQVTFDVNPQNLHFSGTFKREAVEVKEPALS